jgi:hypothetical protein
MNITDNVSLQDASITSAGAGIILYELMTRQEPYGGIHGESRVRCTCLGCRCAGFLDRHEASLVTLFAPRVTRCQDRFIMSPLPDDSITRFCPRPLPPSSSERSPASSSKTWL